MLSYLQHQEIRFRILFLLYIKHYSNELGHPQVTNTLIEEEQELKYSDNNLLYGEIVYLKERGLVKGTDVLGTPYPYTLMITSSGIDIIVKLLKEFVESLGRDDKTKDSYDHIDAIQKFSSKLSAINQIIQEKPQILRTFLGGHTLI